MFAFPPEIKRQKAFNITDNSKNNIFINFFINLYYLIIKKTNLKKFC